MVLRIGRGWFTARSHAPSDVRRPEVALSEQIVVRRAQ